MEKKPPVKGFASEAQRETFRRLVDEGTITQEHFDAKEKATAKNIPARIHPKKGEK